MNCVRLARGVIVGRNRYLNNLINEQIIKCRFESLGCGHTCAVSRMVEPERACDRNKCSKCEEDMSGESDPHDCVETLMKALAKARAENAVKPRVGRKWRITTLLPWIRFGEFETQYQSVDTIGRNTGLKITRVGRNVDSHPIVFIRWHELSSLVISVDDNSVATICMCPTDTAAKRINNQLSLTSEAGIDNKSLGWESVVKITENTTSGHTLGAGLIIDDKGYVLTSAQVVCDLTHVGVTFAKPYVRSQLLSRDMTADEIQTIYGRVVYVDPGVELALIRLFTVKPGVLRPLPLTDTNTDPKCGQTVVAFGCSTLDQSFITGVIASVDRVESHTSQGSHAYFQVMLNADHKHIQHSATISDGYSGGPVVDTSGRLIGISLNTSIRSDGIFFAAFAADIIAFVKRGLEYETRDRDMKYSFANRKSLGVVLYKDMNASNKVFKVCKFTPFNAFNNLENGLQINDYIMKINGKPFHRLYQLTDAIDAHKPNEKLILTVYRNKQYKDIDITPQLIHCYVA
ncbi:unnamed protein product [Medioppia subpectinata]|uniref:Serine protease HTRA2, mitochondrial n=1 Tax=Medioppia subpectinata TaxID=1979941 RepID=A0A7R9Q1A1_9ACAR|nr:unnamed protein product [Medioppia subpectinata]CAG2108982.1 unnamed protein product [Medioppia subpectinata]